MDETKSLVEELLRTIRFQAIRHLKGDRPESQPQLLQKVEREIQLGMHPGWSNAVEFLDPAKRLERAQRMLVDLGRDEGVAATAPLLAFLRRFARSSTAHIERSAADWERGIERRVDLSDRADETAAEAALQALVATQSPRALTGLMKLDLQILSNASGAVAELAQALGQQGIRILEKASRDKEPGVRSRAVEALSTLHTE